MYYSKATGGFYSGDIHGAAIPSDAVEITVEERNALLVGQSSGLRIEADEHGRPTLRSPLVDTSPERYARDIAVRRYQAETAGLKVGGLAISTDRESQGLVTGAAVASMLSPDYVCQWKTEAGFVDLDAKQILSIASAIRAHVQVCFDREAELLAHLENGTFAQTMLNEGWPT
ncbi:DUF4376 domain-containing protein [Pseudomonas sp. PSE14]|uniref:DUF4376 domain-containing protein n=1 Tax=Pseudomonas sp. PSE14 TaxID=3016341 RepID=UPI0023D84FEF|nr:DUF4376 domain-containing protein [Pseudomonas sp. PSE14]WEJ72834.1 DUF4376 domain-containing protein [Pseudomonas sp. PSE14]